MQQPTLRSQAVPATTRRRPRRPPASVAPQGGALPSVDFSTFVGPLASLTAVIDQWERLVDAAGLRLTTPPRIHELSPQSRPFAERILRVAAIRHPPAIGPRLVAGLSRQITAAGISGITVELGYYYRPVSASRSAGPSSGKAADRWSVAWEPWLIARLASPTRTPVPDTLLGARFVDAWAAPPRAVVIDTGDERADRQTLFDTWDAAEEVPCDYHGHGTTIGELLRRMSPDARVESFRIMQRDEVVARSEQILCAVTEAVGTAGLFDLVCIPQRAEISLQKRGHQRSIHRMIHQNAESGVRTPVVVCAAGNTAPDFMAYPAEVPGVVVANAVDRQGRPADYNCPPSPGLAVHLTYALGGTEEDPLGTLTGPGRHSPLFGSSYAAAIVAGMLLARR